MSLIPNHVNQIALKLEEKGFETYLVGGSLRNILSGHAPKDYDLTTNALPEQIVEIFPKSVATNAKFGTITVFAENDFGELDNVEVTTYRSEKDYVGGRWPSHVEFTKSLEEDLKRRDFTVNALALRLVSNLQLSTFNTPNEILNSSNLVDLFNGVEDLNKKILRAVGNPIERFEEDGLRSLRACRLASVYGFTIEEKTFDAIKKTLNVAAQISSERVRDEFTKMILKSPKPSVGLELMRESGLLQLYIPELLEGYGMEQNKFHVHDVYQHILDSVDIANEEVRIAALFHDIGKPRCKDGEHFYGHDQVGAEMTKEILTRLKFPKKDIEDIANLVRWHMFFIPHHEIKNLKLKIKNSEQINIKDNKIERDEMFQSGWSDAAIRRMIKRVGGQEQIDKLLQLRIADATSNPKSSFDPTDIDSLSERISKIREEDSILSVKDLKISGHDLQELGVLPGPKMKEILNELLEMVLDNIELNQKEILIEKAKELI